MRYSFKEILNAEIYEDTRVMFVLGKYTWFNNMVCDTLKYISVENEDTFNTTVSISDEFGLQELSDTNTTLSNSVDFNTFMSVIGVSSITGKWYCRVDLSTLTKKQKEQLMKYIKEPSENGVLVVVSTEWTVYKDILKNRTLGISKVSHLIQLNFPNRPVLKSIVAQTFSEKGIEIDSAALDLFLIKMSTAYDKYEEQINTIVDIHKEKDLNIKQLKVYMKGVENYVIDDFVRELTKPMASDKTNSKKVLKIMSALEDEIGAKNLVYQTLKQVDECIEYRLLINSGYIPIGINYFFKDVVKKLPNKEKYEKMNEWTFRKKASLASSTSLRDWEYMKLMLTKAIENVRVSDEEMNNRCKTALYEVCTRSVISADRINNIIGISNVLNNDLSNINRIMYDEDSLNKIQEEIELANSQ